jgi:hypothetical protein
VDPALRAALATLAVLAVAGGTAVLLAPPLAARRLERIGLLVHHGFALAVAAAAAMSALFDGGDGRPLFLCAVGPLLVLCLQDAVGPRLPLTAIPLIVLGFVAQGLLVAGVVSVAVVGGACAGLATGVCFLGAAICRVRAKALAVPRQRALLEAQTIALTVAGVGGAISVLPWAPVGAWAIALGTAEAIGTASRIDASAPPSLRDVLPGVILGAFAFVAGMAAGIAPVLAIGAALWIALALPGVVVLVRASAPVARASFVEVKSAPLPDSALPSASALAAMSPLLDDAAMLRPQRPRVISRVTARRLLDAALERARAAQPVPPGARGREQLRVDIVAQDNEADIDADPGELSEALCAVLDNALRVRAQTPTARVQVQVRGGPSVVTFEISDTGTTASMPNPDAPFLAPRLDDTERPGTGVALARARLLVERNGGKLMTRSSDDGSFVQVTVPRRMQKGAIGQA